MRLRPIALVGCGGLLALLAASLVHRGRAPRPRIEPAYGQLPIAFERNQGQVDGKVKFLAHGRGINTFLTQSGATFALHDGPWFRMNLVGANAVEPVGADELSGKVHYFIGNDPARWRTHVPTYAKVAYAGVYRGIDLVYYGNQRQLEYDFVVGSGADPDLIRLTFTGVDALRIAGGDLILNVGNREITQHRPRVYQWIDGKRRDIGGAYVLAAGERVAFHVGAYDRRYALVLDPVLVYSTYLGGSRGDSAYHLAVDTGGNVYAFGDTSSIDFPTAAPLQPSFRGGTSDAFVTKLNATGSALIYSTYLGGSGNDFAFGAALDSAGNIYVTGSTTSRDFPTSHAFQPVMRGISNAFVAKLNPAGSELVYSSYLGGFDSDFGLAIAVDQAGATYLAGRTSSPNFPTSSPFQPMLHGRTNVFVTKLNPAGSSLIYSTFLGGTGSDSAAGIAVDAAGSAYVTGGTRSSDFPTMAPIQLRCSGEANAFVTKFNPAGSALVYSTYLGGSVGDGASAVAVDGSGSAYVTGSTQSPDFPTVAALQPVLRGGSDAFVTKLNPAGSAFVFSTYFGGSGDELGLDIALDGSGRIYLTGDTSSPDLPRVAPLQPSYGGGRYDAFVAALNPAGSALLYSSHLGGSDDDEGTAVAVSSAGEAYFAGATNSPNFPTAHPLQPMLGGGFDAFIAKVSAPTGARGGQGSDADVEGGSGCNLAGSNALPWSTLGWAAMVLALIRRKRK